MNAPAKHTPTPWRVHHQDASMRHRRSLITSAANVNSLVASCDVDTRDGTRAGNAEHIVRCVNAHDDLLEFARRMEWSDHDETASHDTAMCPCCGAWRKDAKHDDGCEWVALIAKAEGRS